MSNNPPSTLMMMTRIKRKVTRVTRAAGTVLFALFAGQLCACGCGSQPPLPPLRGAQPSNQAKPAIHSAVVHSLENGAYAVLGEARQDAQAQDVQTHRVQTDARRGI